jgi:hypothetical protein
MTESWLELRVDVLLLINLICEGMEAEAVIPVLIEEVHGHLVLAQLQSITFRQINSSILMGVFASLVDLLAVNNQVFYLNPVEVHEEWLLLLWHLFDVESGRNLSEEGLPFW